jgi:hypothetical protein
VEAGQKRRAGDDSSMVAEVEAEAELAAAAAVVGEEEEASAAAAAPAPAAGGTTTRPLLLPQGGEEAVEKARAAETRTTRRRRRRAPWRWGRREVDAMGGGGVGLGRFVTALPVGRWASLLCLLYIAWLPARLPAWHFNASGIFQFTLSLLIISSLFI